MTYDNEKIISALNDNQYFITLISKMEEQLRKWNQLSQDQQNEYPFWWDEVYDDEENDNENKNDEKNGKIELDDDDDDHGITRNEIEAQLNNMELEESKQKYLASILWDTLARKDQHHIEKILNIILRKNMNQIINCILDDNVLRQTVKEANENLEQQIQLMNPIQQQIQRQKETEMNVDENENIFYHYYLYQNFLLKNLII